jgi:TATA-box binding protein (TBP) (component of TFIID and TFIIIB)
MNLVTYKKFLEENPKIKDLDPNDFPKDLLISTITQTCKLPVKFNVISIAKRLPLSSNFIHTVKCGNSGEIFRSIDSSYKKIRRKKVKFSSTPTVSKYLKNFYNQVTIVISTHDKIKMNIKFFRNGAIQITGSTNVSAVIWSLDCIFKLIKKLMIDTKINYVIPAIFLDIRDLYEYNIGMINSNFNIGFKINRETLFELLKDTGYDCAYDPARYAGVKLRYETGDEKIRHVSTIPIFESGAVIITGSRSYRELIECYKFINTYLIENYSKIVRLQ